MRIVAPDGNITGSLIDVARGNSPPDLLLKDPFIVNVFTGEIERTSVAIKDGFIAGAGDYMSGHEVINLNGKYLIPGLIDGHIHIESSMLTPPGFASAAVLHGTTAIIADPHEIVNVAGLDGLRYMMEMSVGLPLDIFYMIPSCVPATPLETSGAIIGPEEIRHAFNICPQSPGLAEMMNFPGVYLKTPEVVEKIRLACGDGRLIDGHAPMLSGKNLVAYISAGITTDHECTTAKEALEKLRLGMKIIIREGSAAKNLLDLLSIVNERTWPNIFFGCDDLHPKDLINEGGIDNIVRKAAGAGLDPVTAIRMATINPARHYNLRGYGGIAPGYRADLAVIDDLRNFCVEMVIKSGKLVARDGRLLHTRQFEEIDEKIKNTVRLPDLTGRLRLQAPPPGASARIIEVFPNQVITGKMILPASEIEANQSISRVAVVERHGKNGNVALGLVSGFGRLDGALASTVAHDSHNIILAGSNEGDMELAARVVAAKGGGLAVVSGGKMLAELPLPVGGLMSGKEAGEVVRQQEDLHQAAKYIGCILPAPFMTMSFLALPVIPELRITDRVLVDVNRFDFVDLWKISILSYPQ